MTTAEAIHAEVARLKQALETEPRLMMRQTLFKQLWRLLNPRDERPAANEVDKR